EVELHLIKQRMAAGRLAKAGRGELAVPLPAGYVRRPSGEVGLDPDEQVQAVGRLGVPVVWQVGTGDAVLGFLVWAPVRVRGGERGGSCFGGGSRGGGGGGGAWGPGKGGGGGGVFPPLVF